MKLKKVHSAVIASALTASMVITPVFADPTQQELEEQKANAQSELESFQTELDTLIQKANDLEIELINTGQEITQAEKDLEAAKEYYRKALPYLEKTRELAPDQPKVWGLALKNVYYNLEMKDKEKEIDGVLASAGIVEPGSNNSNSNTNK